MNVVTSEEFPHGLRCMECHQEMLPGSVYASASWTADADRIVCLDCLGKDKIAALERLKEEIAERLKEEFADFAFAQLWALAGVIADYPNRPRRSAMRAAYHAKTRGRR